jgi:MoxR-like ATPase
MTPADPTNNQQQATQQAQQQAPQQAPKLASPDFQSQIDFMAGVIDNMLSGANKRILVGGKTGLGKTSFVKQFAKVFGFPTIIVEIPHIVEEQMINIPFVIFDKNGQSSQGYDQVKMEKEGSSPKVELGSSYLATKLANLTKLSDVEYRTKVNSYDSTLKELIRQFEEQYPGTIAKVRSKYDKILFLDEYFRQTTPAIRNILRNILNDRIGNDIIPAGTYVMYASNLEDVSGSIDPQSSHTTFFQKKFKAPTKSQWLSYTVSSAVGQGVHIKQEVVDAFDKSLKDEHVSYDDLNLEIRTSPRRWSDIFIYINNAFPFKSPDELGILKTTIKKQFQNDQGNTSDLYNVVEALLARLAIQSNIDPKKVKEVSPEQWRDVLAQQVMTVMQSKGMKKYVPVIQGLPGVGKTAIGGTFENPPYNMRFIPILATTLSRDSVVGIPLPKEQNKQMGVEFAKPELAIKIDDDIERANKSYFNRLQKREKEGKLNGKTAQEAYRDFENQEYKYLIFIDEINRVKDVAIFNSLRRLILEKEFNDQYKLPKGAVVVAAMNPSDLGTIPMTSHFRDAIDLIDVEPSWKDTIKFIKNQVVPYLKNEYNPSDIALDTSLQIVETFPQNFSLGRRRTAKEFYIAIGGSEELYLSPRDYDNMFKVIVSAIDRVANSLKEQIKRGKTFSQDEVNNRIIRAAAEVIESTFDDLFYKAGMGTPPGWDDRVLNFLNKIVDVSLQMKSTKAGLGSLLDDVIAGTTQLKDDIDFDNYMADYMPAKFQKDFDEYLHNMIKTTENIQDVVDSLKIIITQFGTAIRENQLNPDVLNRIENTIHVNFNEVLKSTEGSEQEDAARYLAKNYSDLLDMLGVDA